MAPERHARPWRMAPPACAHGGLYRFDRLNKINRSTYTDMLSTTKSRHVCCICRRERLTIRSSPENQVRRLTFSVSISRSEPTAFGADPERRQAKVQPGFHAWVRRHLFRWSFPRMGEGTGARGTGATTCRFRPERYAAGSARAAPQCSPAPKAAKTTGDSIAALPRSCHHSAAAISIEAEDVFP